MLTLPFCGKTILIVSTLLIAATVCYGAAANTVVEVTGFGECTDCLQHKIKHSLAVKGLKVTIDCKLANGEVKTRATGKLDVEGKFRVYLPNELVEDGKLKEECHAQLHGASNTPCPAYNAIESSKLSALSETSDGKHTFRPIGKLKFSSSTCASAFFWPPFKLPPVVVPKIPKKYFPFPPFWKIPCPPFAPIWNPPPVPVYPKPPVPVHPKPPVPGHPVYPKPPVPGHPIYPKPPVPGHPVYPKPPVPGHPIYPKPPVPVHPKPLPPSVPYKKPSPPKEPITLPPFPNLPPLFPKPLPPFKPITLPPLPKLPPWFHKKPCPPLPPLPKLPPFLPNLPFPKFPPLPLLKKPSLPTYPTHE